MSVASASPAPMATANDCEPPPRVSVPEKLKLCVVVGGGRGALATSALGRLVALAEPPEIRSRHLDT